MTEPEDVRCERCHRPLKDTDSRTRGYGRVCADIVLGVDTHRTPIPRAEHPTDPNQIPLPLENTVTSYTVHFTQTTSVSIDVEAEDHDEAIEKAHEEGVPGICAQCSGWGQDWSRDDDGELTEVAVTDKATGKDVWTCEPASA